MGEARGDRDSSPEPTRTKKSHRIRRYILVFIAAVGLYSIFLVVRRPILLKLALSSKETRVVGLPDPCQVTVNQQNLRGAKCFRITTAFARNLYYPEDKGWTRPVDYLLLWLPDRSVDRVYSVLMADLQENNAGRPSNANNLNLDLLWNHILVQSHAADGYLSFDDSVKFCGLDPNFQSTGNRIQFTPPIGCSSDWLGGKTLVITMQ